MTLDERRALVARDIRRQRAPIRQWLRSKRRSADSNIYRRCAALGVRVPGSVCVHGQRLVHDLHVERNLDAAIAAAAAARAARAAPAHLALWRCIAGYPGARPDGTTGESGGYSGASNGTHFNVLQMTMPWGKGDYYVADPIHASPEQIIAAAERGYAENHSIGWLEGQWGQTVGPCLQYA